MTHCKHDNKELIVNQVGEPIAERCNQCGAVTPIVRLSTESTVGTWVNECEWCGHEYNVVHTSPWYAWVSKRFCSDLHYREDLADRKSDHRPLLRPGQLSPGNHDR